MTPDYDANERPAAEPGREPMPPIVPPAPPSVPSVAPPPPPIDGPLPVCDYTGDSDEPCEEPAVQRRWSSATVIFSAAFGAITGGLLVAVAVAWALGYIPGVRPLVETPDAAPEAPSRSEVTITPNDDDVSLSEAVANKAVPSVVNVSIQQTQQNPFTGETQTQTVGNGSGVVIRENGYIITNNHVVEDADRIMVTIGVEDKEATLVGTDPSSDLAVLKIEGTGYPAIQIGSSTDLKVGEYVMALGSPFNLERTVTVGIVSALNRSQLLEGRNDLTTYTNLIQTDAAINPGNSGGALVDAQARLVGINTLIQSTSGQSAGVGFAIPVDFAMDIANQIITSGRATHAYMGVSTAALNEAVAEEFGLPVTEGAFVRFVQPGSPAEKAGIKAGDIIVRIDGVDIEGVEDVYAAVRQNKVGDDVPVELVREDTRRDVTVTLGSDADRP